MQRVGRPYPLLILPFIAVVFQAIQTTLASNGINPGPIKHPASGVNTVEPMVGRDNVRLYPQGAQCLDTRHGRIQFALFHIMRQPMLRIPPAIFGPLFVKHLDVMVQWRA